MNIRKNHYYVGLTALFFSNCLYAFPAPGSYISNIASGDYADETGNILIVNSNPVSLEVQKILALTLVQNQQQQGTAGGQVNFPHVLTNTGNTLDTYKLSLIQPKGDDFDLKDVQIYADRDQNGIPDDQIDLLTSNTSVALKAGESLSVVVVGNIPLTVATAQKSIFELKATSQTTNSLLASVNDTVIVVDDAVISVLKAQDKSQGNVTDVITYTLTYRNNGTDTAKLTITDVLDDSLQYIAQSAQWNQSSVKLTDADDTENTVNVGIKYQLDNKTIKAEIASVPPLSSGVLTFQVNVKNADKTKIPNTAKYIYIGNKSTASYSLDSNTVHYTLAPSLGVVLNNKSSSSSNIGDDDNLVTKNELKPGQEVLFKNYVWNTGNITDVYNLSYTLSNLPACAQVRLYGKDGKTLLTDTNGDGVVDTGSLATGAVKEIQVGVLASTSCNTEISNITVDVKATSVTSSDISDPTRNVITKLVASSSESDLYNSNKSGQGVNGGIGEIDNGGEAWLKGTVIDGKVVFPLVAENKSTQSNNYNLFASFAAIDPKNISVVTASGFTVKFYEGDATCTTLGQQITNTGTVAAGKTKNYCAVIQVDSSQQNFKKPIWFAIQSPVNQQADVIKDEIDSSVVRQLILTNDQQGQVSVGGSLVYVHTLKNTGTVMEGSASGSVVKFKVTSLKQDDGFIYSLYYDANNDGKLDAADKFIDANTTLNTLTSSVGIPSQKSIQLLLKVSSSETVLQGTSSVAEIIVEAGDYQGITLADIKNTDVTTVGTINMQLTKYQSVLDCAEPLDQAKVSALAFSTQALAVEPGHCVVYKLNLLNKGISTVNAVQFIDVVPAYTTLHKGPLLLPAGTNQSSGEKISGAVGSLAPGAEANMYFMIRVNP